MKLEVGMYVRVKSGEIHKIKSVANKYVEYENGFGVPFDLKDIIIKASFNIINILEVGDYVNGCKVSGISGTRYDKNDLHCYCDYCQNKETLKWIMIAEKDIKSIVTHEQMEQISYKLGE